jgi:hypothetical protein
MNSKELLKSIENIVATGKKTDAMIPMLDLMALMATDIEESKVEIRRMRESLTAMINKGSGDGKQVPLPAERGGNGGFSIG